MWGFTLLRVSCRCILMNVLMSIILPYRRLTGNNPNPPHSGRLLHYLNQHPCLKKSFQISKLLRKF